MKSHTVLQSRFWALLLSSFALTALLSACAFDNGNSTSASGSQNGYVFTNPNVTPPPPFPPVTIGAWMSNMTPSKGDAITLYVILRAQPADMKTAPSPIANIPVSANGLHGTTGIDGIAAIPVSTASCTPAQPVRIDVSASANSTNVSTSTFYTCLPASLPGTPTGTATPTH